MEWGLTLQQSAPITRDWFKLKVLPKVNDAFGPLYTARILERYGGGIYFSCRDGKRCKGDGFHVRLAFKNWSDTNGDELISMRRNKSHRLKYMSGSKMWTTTEKKIMEKALVEALQWKPLRSPRYKQAIAVYNSQTTEPWQLALAGLIQKCYMQYDDYHIHVALGKAAKAKTWFEHYVRAKTIPVISLPHSLCAAHTIVSYACSKTEEGGHYIFTFEVKHTLSKKQWLAIELGLEEIKQGFLYDTRYSCKEKVIEPPMVVCFVHAKTPEGVMSGPKFSVVELPP